MVHPVKTPLGAARALTRLSLEGVRHPVRTTTGAVALGRGLIAAAIATAGGGRHQPAAEASGPASGPALGPTSGPAEPAPSRKVHGDPLEDAAEEASAARPAPTGPAGPAGPAESMAPAEPVEPVEPVEPRVTEPSAIAAAGDADEVPAPVARPTGEDDEDLEVTTPVGTTGAGEGYNPDTTDTDLQQVGTEPLMDPATTKRIKSESDVLRRAADTRKG